MRSTITDLGRELISRAELGEISLEIAEIRAGNGIYSAHESINGLTALKSEKNTYPVSAATVTETGLLLSAVISNVNGSGQAIVTESYRVNEIGVFVESSEGGKYLYMIAVEDNNEGNMIPAFNGENAVDFIEKFSLTVSNTAHVTVSMTGAYALADDVEDMRESLLSHDGDEIRHITAAERTAWNAKANASAFNTHDQDAVRHITAAERTAWNSKASGTDFSSHASDTTKHITAAERTAWNAKASGTDFSSHASDTTKHITAAERTAWNAKADATTLTNQITTLDRKKQNNEKVIQVTISASGWSGSTYSFESSYPNASWDILDIIPCPNTTRAMRAAWGEADCAGYEATNKITAHGKVPAINLIMEMRLRFKTPNAVVPES